MKSNSNLNGVYSQRLKDIRPFINFNYDLRKPLTAHQKRRINEYYNEIQALTHRPYQVYKPRRKDHLKTAQKFAQHEKKLPGLKVAFIPTNGDEKTKIEFTKKGQLIAKTKHVRTEHIDLDEDALLEDAFAHVNKRIKKYKSAKRFTILAGKYEIPRTYSREKIAEGVNHFVAKYSDDTANNYFGNWLHGLAAHHFKEQAELDEYMKAKDAARAKVKRERKAANARRQRERNKAK